MTFQFLRLGGFSLRLFRCGCLYGSRSFTLGHLEGVMDHDSVAACSGIFAALRDSLKLAPRPQNRPKSDPGSQNPKTRSGTGIAGPCEPAERPERRRPYSCKCFGTLWSLCILHMIISPVSYIWGSRLPLHGSSACSCGRIPGTFCDRKSGCSSF